MSKLRTRREEMSLRIKDVASVVGTDQSSLSRIERGLQVPDPQLARRLAGYLGLSLEEIYGPPIKVQLNEEL